MSTFKVGDLVKHKASFLKSIGWYTGVPKDGRVAALDGHGWPFVQWRDEPGLAHEAQVGGRINPANIMLASEPDYSGF